MWIGIAQHNSTRPPLDTLKSIIVLLRQPWVPYRHSVLQKGAYKTNIGPTVTRSLTHKPWLFNILSMNSLPLARLGTSEMWTSHLRSFVILIPKILTTSVLCRSCPRENNVYLTTVEWFGFKLTFLEKDICHDHEIDIIRSLAKLQLRYV